MSQIRKLSEAYAIEKCGNVLKECPENNELMDAFETTEFAYAAGMLAGIKLGFEGARDRVSVWLDGDELGEGYKYETVKDFLKSLGVEG